MITIYVKDSELDKIKEYSIAYKQAIGHLDMLDMEDNLLTKLNSVYPGAVRFFEFKISEKGAYLNCVFIGYERNGIHYAVVNRRASGKGMNYLFSPEVYKMEYENGFSMKSRYPKEPKNIRVFTRKKIETWIEYIDQVHTIMKQAQQEADAFRQNYLRQLEGEKIIWSDEEHSKGKIIRNGLILSFQFSGCKVYQEIGLAREKKENYDLFKAMADNRYQDAL